MLTASGMVQRSATPLSTALLNSPMYDGNPWYKTVKHITHFLSRWGWLQFLSCQLFLIYSFIQKLHFVLLFSKMLLILGHIFMTTEYLGYLKEKLLKKKLQKWFKQALPYTYCNKNCKMCNTTHHHTIH